MRIISHEDSELKPFEETISGFTGLAKALGMSYWLFVEDKQPVGLLYTGKEPVQLLAPLGTPVARIQLYTLKLPAAVLENFLSEAHNLAMKNDVDLVSATFPSKHENLATRLEEMGFEEVANSYRMVCPLTKSFEPTAELVFERVKRGELGEYLTHFIECLSGSPDTMVEIIMNNIRGMPDKFLDIWYNMQHLYWAYKDGKAIGILDLSLQNKFISNIGVAPKHRGKGYGRQIMLFALQTLTKEGGEQAGLRVHKDNKVAISLYESLGFKIAEQNQTFIWRK